MFTWKELIIPLQGLDSNALLETWRWLVPATYQPIMLTKFADWFFTDPAGRVFMLDLVYGEFRQVAPRLEAFNEMLVDENTWHRWFMPGIVRELTQRGLFLKDGQCFGFKLPPVLGGEIDPHNIIATDIAQQLRLMSQIHQRSRQVTATTLAPLLEQSGTSLDLPVTGPMDSSGGSTATTPVVARSRFTAAAPRENLLIGLSFVLFSHLPDAASANLFPVLREAGFDAVEIHLHDAIEPHIKTLRDASADTGLRVACSTALPQAVSLLSPVAKQRDAARHALRQALHLASELNATQLLGPLHAPPAGANVQPGETQLNRAADSLHEFAELASAAKVTLTLIPANRYESPGLNTLADATELVARVAHPNLRCGLNTFHANIEERSIPLAIRAAGPSLACIQLAENDRGQIGLGSLPWLPIAQALAQIDYNDLIIIETLAEPTSLPPTPPRPARERNTSPANAMRHAKTYIDNLRRQAGL